jgi:hypothetical protein
MRAAALLLVTTALLAACAAGLRPSPSSSATPAPSSTATTASSIPATADPTTDPTPTPTLSPGYVVWYDPTPYPAPAGATPLQLAVEPPAQPQPSGQNLLCALGLYVPVRLGRSGDAVTLTNTYGDVNALIWPRGFAAWLVDGKAEILAPDGTLVGREGDTLANLGGGGDTICSVGDKMYLPSP